MYLGDSVYVSLDPSGMLTLETRGGKPQLIYLEPAVYAALVEYAISVGFDKRKKE